MKKKLSKFLLASIAIATVIFTGANAYAEVKMVMVNGELRPSYKEGEVIVKYKDNAFRPMREAAALYQRLDVVNVKHFSGNFKNFEHISFNTARLSVEQVVSELQRDPSVEYAQPNYMIYAFPNKLAKNPNAEPCLIPGLPFPPGCEDSGGGTPPPGDDPGKQPCLIPGIPFPPGCEDSGGGAPGPTPPPGGSRPAIEPMPAEPAPAADVDLNKAWGVAKTSADKAWAIQKGSKSVVVAVIDTGVDYNHPDLAFNMWRKPGAAQVQATGVDPEGLEITGDVVGWNFVHNDNLPFDDNQHGTHCAGVIGAVGNDGKGISGVNQRVSVMAVKFLSGQGSGESADAIKSIDYAVSRGAKVLSNSWGGKGDDGTNQALKDAIVRAGQAGVLFVAAAGNDSTNNDKDPVFPASFNLENMVNVAATTEKDGIAYFSNTGAASVHIGAPGTNVYSTVPGNRYASLSGTSMACPHVAGAAALIWAQYPTATYQQIKQRLMIGDALPALNGKTITGNRLNVDMAIKATL